MRGALRPRLVYMGTVEPRREPPMSNRALGAVPKVVNFIQILFCNGCMVTLTEAPAQSGRPSIQLFDRSPSGHPQLLAPEIVERKGLAKGDHHANACNPRRR